MRARHDVACTLACSTPGHVEGSAAAQETPADIAGFTLSARGCWRAHYSGLPRSQNVILLFGHASVLQGFLPAYRTAANLRRWVVMNSRRNIVPLGASLIPPTLQSIGSQEQDCRMPVWHNGQKSRRAEHEFDAKTPNRPSIPSTEGTKGLAD